MFLIVTIFCIVSQVQCEHQNHCDNHPPKDQCRKDKDCGPNSECLKRCPKNENDSCYNYRCGCICPKECSQMINKCVCKKNFKMYKGTCIPEKDCPCACTLGCLS